MNSPPIPPRLPPNIKLDPNLPGVNLNITVADWLALQEQYNAEHPQNNDNDNIAEDDIHRDPNFGIRVNADVHHRHDDDTRSTDSTDAGEGFHRVVAHIAKPVGVLLDPTARDDPARLERSKQHLNRLTPAYVSGALMKDEIIIQQQNDVRNMQDSMRDLQLQMKLMLQGHLRGQNSLLEKTGRIKPNLIQTYPHSDSKAPEQVYQSAVSALSQKMVTVGKNRAICQVPILVFA